MTNVCIRASLELIVKAISSFACGSVGSQMVCTHCMKDKHHRETPSVIIAITSFTNLILAGRTPTASLVALNKEVGCVRPIVVGCTLNHLVAKISSMNMR